MKTVKILNTPVHAITLEEVLEEIRRFIRSGKPHQIMTTNPEFVLEAQQNKEFRQALHDADLSIADGSGIVWAARFKNHPLPERIPGADLVTELARLSGENSWTLYLLGGGPGIAEQAARRLAALYPDVKIAGAEGGISPAKDSELFNEKEVAAVINRINRANPDILLVAFGAPRQDLFIARYKKELGVPVMIGVGGTFDYLAGRVRRAPQWLRTLSLEWFWRLLMEPKRWRRIYKALVIFPFKVILSK